MHVIAIADFNKASPNALRYCDAEFDERLLLPTGTGWSLAQTRRDLRLKRVSKNEHFLTH